MLYSIMSCSNRAEVEVLARSHQLIDALFHLGGRERHDGPDDDGPADWRRGRRRERWPRADAGHAGGAERPARDRRAAGPQRGQLGLPRPGGTHGSGARRAVVEPRGAYGENPRRRASSAAPSRRIALAHTALIMANEDSCTVNWGGGDMRVALPRRARWHCAPPCTAHGPCVRVRCTQASLALLLIATGKFTRRLSPLLPPTILLRLQVWVLDKAGKNAKAAAVVRPAREHPRPQASTACARRDA